MWDEAAPVMVPCPRCDGTGLISTSRVSWYAAVAWETHKDDECGYVEAIKMLRSWTGLSLKDAKDAIERARAIDNAPVLDGEASNE